MVEHRSHHDRVIDKWVNDGFIQSPALEKILRAVNVYKYSDVAIIDSLDGRTRRNRNNIPRLIWANNVTPAMAFNLLNLQPGMSFLTIELLPTYVSLAAGLILGRHGINHGVVLKTDFLEDCRSKIKQFEKKSRAIDRFDFCTPELISGNIFENGQEPVIKYDVIYCPFECADDRYKTVIKRLMKAGGAAVLCNGKYILSVTREGNTDRLVPTSPGNVFENESDFRRPHCCTCCNAGPTVPVLWAPQPKRLGDMCTLEVRDMLRKKLPANANYKKEMARMVNQLMLPRELKKQLNLNRVVQID